MDMSWGMFVLCSPKRSSWNHQKCLIPFLGLGNHHEISTALKLSCYLAISKINGHFSGIQVPKLVPPKKEKNEMEMIDTIWRTDLGIYWFGHVWIISDSRVLVIVELPRSGEGEWRLQTDISRNSSCICDEEIMCISGQGKAFLPKILRNPDKDLAMPCSLS